MNKDDEVAGGSACVISGGFPPAEVIARLPLPGAIILVHGVNSVGEWFEQAEEGLCRGLHKRLGLTDAAVPPYRPVRYRSEYRVNGEIERDLGADNFITDPGRSPVIRFRWGFKASDDNIAVSRATVLLDDVEAWGGGPFQNGTGTVPDLWSPGLNDRTFLWIHLQHLMKQVKGRQLYECPPRAYFVHAAKRLALLVKTIRERDPACPVTILCHSQGNMVTIASAFIGQHSFGGEGVADTYVMVSPPYGLHSLFLQDWQQRTELDAEMRAGDICTADRVECLRKFVGLVAARRGKGPSVARINAERRLPATCAGYRMSETFPLPEVAAGAQDRDNRGHVFLYANPHDQVIGATPVQGIGWRGVENTLVSLSEPPDGGRYVFPKKVELLNHINGIDYRNPAAATFHQRVFAQGLRVGAPDKPRYRYLKDHYDPAVLTDPKRFWFPPAPEAKYRRGYGRLFLDHVLQADEGCDFGFLQFADDADEQREPHGLLSGWQGGW